MKDFCDGKSFSTHPLFSIKANALQVLLYFDELEICDPLGSKTKKHKLGNKKINTICDNQITPCYTYRQLLFYIGKFTTQI